MSARIKSQEIARRTVIPSRNSDAPDLRVQADLDASRGHSAISLAAVEAFGKLGAVASRIKQDRDIRKRDEEVTLGQKDRFTETTNGAPAQAPETLAERTAGYRQGYYLTEGVNRVNEAKLAIAREVAKLRPGESAQPIIQKHLGTLLEAPEFQDPAIRKQLQPTLMQLQQNVAEYHQKVELAEIFDSQRENLRGIARAGIQDGSLVTADGIDKFRAALNTEQFAYLSPDDADDILAGAYVDLIESGDIDTEQAQVALQQPASSDSTALWDREGWADKFETAVAAGSAIRQRRREEQQAEALAGIEHKLQARASRGQLAVSEIHSLADRVGIHGKDRLTFVRRWIDQNDAGLKHLQSEANRAREHREVIAAINAGQSLSLTGSQLSKAAEREWASAVTSGDQKRRAEVIARYTRAGVVIPQLKDLLSRTTARNLNDNYILYDALVQVDPVVADRYLSDENAVLFEQHHNNVAKFGMSEEESLRALPTGASKVRRPEVASAVTSASSRYFKDNPNLPNGKAREPGIAARIQQEAIRLGVANPNATPEDNLRVAERRVMSDLIEVRGRMVPIGDAHPAAGPLLGEFLDELETHLIKEGHLSEGMRGKLYAAPANHTDGARMAYTSGRFVVLLPNGFPVAHPSTGKPLGFYPREIAGARQDYNARKRAHEVMQNQRANQQLRRSPPPVTFGTVDTPGALKQMADDQAAAVRNAREAAEVKPFPDFPTFLQEFRTKRKQSGQ
jgi:hypothetical protein